MTDLLPDRQILTITQLNRRVRQLLETHLALIWVQGEISNLARPASGHWYFTLKDRDAQIRCAMFRNRNSLTGFVPKEGEQVVVRGRVSLYENRGDYQLIAEHMEPDGVGRLQQQFEQLKHRLGAEGLFDPDHKRELPSFPSAIGVVTSPSGAAIRDIIHVLQRRAPWIPVRIYPTAVQGKQSAADVARAIAFANEDNQCDMLIVGRGGGSLEDLWGFNEEIVARAIFDSAIPVVSAVGHETDFTIADFVADLRAPTPSAAAELASPDGAALALALDQRQSMLQRHIRQQLVRDRRQLDNLRQRLRNPADRLRDQMQHLDHLDIRLARAMHARLGQARQQQQALIYRFNALHPGQRLADWRTRLTDLADRGQLALERSLNGHRAQLSALAATLNAVSPLATVERGYGIVRNPQGRVVRSISETASGQHIDVMLRDGRLLCTVDDVSGEREI
jgi:exodeoxyribonuclease VII large subunit